MFVNEPAGLHDDVARTAKPDVYDETVDAAEFFSVLTQNVRPVESRRGPVEKSCSDIFQLRFGVIHVCSL
jgi:hypothetical protein